MKLYQKIDPEFNREFWPLVTAARKITLTAHYSPDDDAIGSILSLYQIIRQREPAKAISLIITGTSVERFRSFVYFDQIHFAADLADQVADADLLICLDGSQYHRFSHQAEALKKNLPARTICFDHHRSPPDQFDLAIIVPEEPATCSLLYQIFAADFKLDKGLAESLLLGILGDTGNFAFLKPHQTEILLIAKKLLDVAQVEIAEFQSRYRMISQRVFSLIQMLIKNTTYHKTEKWPDWQSSYLPRAVIGDGQCTDNEIGEATHIYMGHYLRAIAGYRWGVVVSPDENGEVSVSARSLPGSANVRELMERSGLGGGHDRAAGGTFKSVGGEMLEPADCLKKIETWLQNNK